MGGSVPDIPGTKANHDLAASFRYEVANLLKRKQTSFPGAQPVSFASKHLDELQREDYYVCEKTDGIRCLMYLTEDQGQEVVYLIDRKNDFYHVLNLHFPLEGDNPEAFHTQTILDGELVNETQQDGSFKMQYLVFDCLVMDGNILTHRTLDKRLAYFREKLFFPYKTLYKQFPEEIKFLPFTMHFKQVEFSYAIQKMFEEVIPNLKHGSDGLIFTCRNSPYTSGTDDHILKWKMETENSIDFRMHLQFPIVEPDSDDEGGSYPDYTVLPRINLTCFGGEEGDIPYGEMTITVAEWDMMKAQNRPLDERVVECYLDKMGKWRFLRFRDDKKESNHKSTVESVMESIRDGVTQKDLINKQARIKDEWKQRQAALEQPRRDQEARKPNIAATQQGMTSLSNGEAVNGSSGIKKEIEESECLPQE